MLTFECCLQQLLGLCIKGLDFILLSARLPHDHPAPAAFCRGGISDSTWREEGQSRRLQLWSVGLGFPDCRHWPALGTGTPGQSLAFGGWLSAHEDWLPAEPGHRPSTCGLV